MSSPISGGSVKYVVVMGQPGSGKTKFIEHATDGKHGVASDSLTLCDGKIDFFPTSNNVVLVDTPGIDPLPGGVILNAVIKDKRAAAARLSVIYLHPINNSSLMQLLPKHLKSIADNDRVLDIAVVTTMWSEGKDLAVLEPGRLRQEMTLKEICIRLSMKAEMVGPQRFEESKESAWDVIMRLGQRDRESVAIDEVSAAEIAHPLSQTSERDHVADPNSRTPPPTSYMTPGERFADVVRTVMRRSKHIASRPGGRPPHVPSTPKHRFRDAVNSVISRQREDKEKERRRSLNSPSTIEGVRIQASPTPKRRFMDVVNLVISSQREAKENERRRQSPIVPTIGGVGIQAPSTPKRRFINVVNLVISRQREAKENERRQSLVVPSTIGGVGMQAPSTPKRRFMDVVNSVISRQREKRQSPIAPPTIGGVGIQAPSTPKRRFMDAVNSVIKKQKEFKENERWQPLIAPATIEDV